MDEGSAEGYKELPDAATGLVPLGVRRHLPNPYQPNRPNCTIMASSTDDGADHDGEIRLWREEEWWIARDVGTGVTTQGESRSEALENLDEAVALHREEIGREPTDEELRELGIDPEENATGDTAPPDVLE
jgi:predicted RNase H-like HicB family nuclease